MVMLESEVCDVGEHVFLTGLEPSHGRKVNGAACPAAATPLTRRFFVAVGRAVKPPRNFDGARTCFANRNIADTVSPLCYDGSSRQPKFIVPSLRDAIKLGIPLNALALASALWCRHCVGERADGTPVALKGPRWHRLNRTARAARKTPVAWLGRRDIYGDVGDDPRLRAAFGLWLDRLDAIKVQATLELFNNSGDRS